MLEYLIILCKETEYLNKLLNNKYVVNSYLIQICVALARSVIFINIGVLIKTHNLNYL